MVWGAHLVPHPQVQRDQHMVDHVVDVHDITVTIKGRTILSNLSIQVEEGTFHGIIGPNGAGKTTLFNAIQGFRKPAQGSIELLGHSPYPRNLDLLTQIGIQPQRPAFFPHTTLREHLCAVADIYAVAASRVDDLIEALGLESCLPYACRETVGRRASTTGRGYRPSASSRCPVPRRTHCRSGPRSSRWSGLPAAIDRPAAHDNSVHHPPP